MSSFLSKSTIGMGGSDSGGSIELPMMDQEVISIGDWRILAGGATFHYFWGACPDYVILPPSAFGGVSKGSGSGDVRESPYVRRSHSPRSSLSTPAVVGYEWVKLASLEDSCMLAVQACGRDNFPFLRAASGSSPFFYMYRCLFEVLGLILPLTAFQCALLEDSNVAPSQLHPNSWAMLTEKIGWVSLNNMSKKLFEANEVPTKPHALPGFRFEFQLNKLFDGFRAFFRGVISRIYVEFITQACLVDS
ncbi:hypothetical protein JHK82_050356 [Glycine max]|nr:hypothetical protein JHK82_050356 [Glycine max]